LEEEFDIDKYCPTRSEISKNSSHSSLDGDLSLKELQSIIEEAEQKTSD
jgi:hypothetical protein